MARTAQQRLSSMRRMTKRSMSSGDARSFFSLTRKKTLRRSLGQIEAEKQLPEYLRFAATLRGFIHPGGKAENGTGQL